MEDYKSGNFPRVGLGMMYSTTVIEKSAKQNGEKETKRSLQPQLGAAKKSFCFANFTKKHQAQQENTQVSTNTNFQKYSVKSVFLENCAEFSLKL